MTTRGRAFQYLLIPMFLSASPACSSDDATPPGDTGGMQEPPSTDTTPPAFAGAAEAVAADPSSAPNTVNLSWKVATDDQTPADKLVYLIYQATAKGGESFAAPTYTTQPGALSYSVGGLQENTQYFFVVRARDAAGNVDKNSVEVSATVPAQKDKQPPAFNGLGQVMAAGLRATLTWTAATDNVTPAAKLVYLIYQADAAGGEKYATPTYTSAPGATSHVVSGLKAGSEYFFVVRAQDESGNVDMNTVEKSVKLDVPRLSTDVQPIFDASCTASRCHNGTDKAAMLDLSSARASAAAIVNVPSGQCAPTSLVTPNKPDESYLVWKLMGAGPCFKKSQMPRGGMPLSKDELDIIRGWISSGAPTN